MKKIFIVFITIILFISSVACRKQDEHNEDDNGGEPQVEFSDKVVAENGVSDYKIVIPANCNEETSFASTEFKQFFYELTDANLPIVEDSNLTYSEEVKYVSIGETSLSKSAGITVDKEALTGEGFRVTIKGSSIFLIGGGSNGVMYSVYDFLEVAYGVKIYAEDEILIPKTSKALLPILDYTEKPDLQIRAINSYEYNNSQIFRRRMRTHLRQEGWIYTSHSFFAIMPLSQYYDNHKDWYSKDKTQLCLSNEEMTEEFIKNVYNLYNKPQYEGAVNCMLGIEDSNTWCTCAKCLEETAKYKESGMMVRFVNKVYKGVREMMDANGQQDKKIRLFIYAYFKTLSAPVDAQGNVLDESVKPVGDIGVMIAPLSAKYDVALNCEENLDVKNQITAWSEIFNDNIYMYIYGANYGLYPLMVNDFGSIKENYQYFEEIGAIGVHHLGSYNALSSDMSQLKNFLQAKLLWDNDLDSEKLIVEFVENYYKDAAPFVMDYINLWRMQYLENQINYNKYSIVNTNASKTWLDGKFWPLDFLTACDTLLNKALEAVEVYQKTDLELYNKLVSRIKLQSLAHRFFTIELYCNVLPVSKLVSYIDSFEKDSQDVGVVSLGEHTRFTAPVAEYVAKWRLLALSRIG